MADPFLYDGLSAHDLRMLLDLPIVEAYQSVGSTMDAGHALGAAGAPGGSLVVAEEQTAGRGRGGRAWRSAAGSGLWIALLERPIAAGGFDVLSLRLGIAAAGVLDRFAPARVQLKWPNDLYLASGKLGGILTESRWRGSAIDWVMIGLGINVRRPEDTEHASSLLPGVRRVEVLAELIAALRAAAAASGALTLAELERFAARDLARGRACREPLRGIVRGIDAGGALVIDAPAGEWRTRAGSLVLEEEP